MYSRFKPDSTDMTCYDLLAVVLQCYFSGKQALNKLSFVHKFEFAVLGPQSNTGCL